MVELLFVETGLRPVSFLCRHFESIILNVMPHQLRHLCLEKCPSPTSGLEEKY
jgi:hypothetical protein